MDPLSASPVPTATVPVPPPPAEGSQDGSRPPFANEDERGAGATSEEQGQRRAPLPPAPDEPSRDSRNLAVAAHLSALIGFTGIPSLVGPLVVWLLRRDDPFVADHARDALNFNLSALVYLVALVALTIVTFGVGVIVLLPVVLIGGPAWLIATIIGAVRASEGRAFRYPLTISFIK